MGKDLKEQKRPGMFMSVILLISILLVGALVGVWFDNVEERKAERNAPLLEEGFSTALSVIVANAKNNCQGLTMVDKDNISVTVIDVQCFQQEPKTTESQQ